MTQRTLPVDVVRLLVDFATRQGWDVEQLVRAAGLPSEVLSTDRGRATEDQLAHLIQALWAATDDELFGLSPVPLPRGSFRLVGYGLVGNKDLSSTLEFLQSTLAALPAISISVSVRPDTTRIGLPELGERDPDQVIPLSGLLISHRLLSWLARAPVRIRQVDVPLPDGTHREALHYLFRAPIHYEARRAALIFDTDDLSHPVVRSPNEVDALVASAPAGLLELDPFVLTTSEQVRRLFESALRNHTPWPTAAEAARHLALGATTLRRHLANEGTSLREIASEVRRDAAVVALVETPSTVAEVADQLGFSDVTGFTRAFRQWTGSTPAAYRLERPRS